MYDLNLVVPNITSSKYTDANRFMLIKNYLYELNETLSFALADKVAQEVALANEKAAIENKKQQENVELLQSRSVSEFKDLKQNISNIQSYENLKCVCTDNAESPVAEIRYYPVSGVVFVRVRLNITKTLLPGITHYLAKIPDRAPNLFTALQSFANLTSGGQSSAGILYKTGDVVFRSDVEIPEGTTVYISGCYIADYKEQEG